MSLISFSATRSRPAAWLGLLAIALLLIAPAIAKSLTQTSDAGGTMMHHQMHEGRSKMMPAVFVHPPSAMKMDPTSIHHSVLMMDDSACGYCVLLAHLAFGLIAVTILRLARRATAPPEVPLQLPFIVGITLRLFYPRAPPSLFISYSFTAPSTCGNSTGHDLCL